MEAAGSASPEESLQQFLMRKGQAPISEAAKGWDAENPLVWSRICNAFLA